MDLGPYFAKLEEMKIKRPISASKIYRGYKHFAQTGKVLTEEEWKKIEEKDNETAEAMFEATEAEVKQDPVKQDPVKQKAELAEGRKRKREWEEEERVRRLLLHPTAKAARDFVERERKNLGLIDDPNLLPLPRAAAMQVEFEQAIARLRSVQDFPEALQVKGVAEHLGEHNVAVFKRVIKELEALVGIPDVSYVRQDLLGKE